MKKRNLKSNFLIALGILSMPSFLISAACKTKDNKTEFNAEFNDKLIEVSSKLKEIKNQEIKDNLIKELLDISEKKAKESLLVLIKKLNDLLDKITKEISKQKKEWNNTFKTYAPSLNKGYKIQYDSSDDFYSSLDGLSGKKLRDALFSLQKANRNKTGKYKQLHETYKSAFVDKYYEKDGNVLDIYTEIPSGIDKYNFRFNSYRDTGTKEGEGMNREHLIAQSWFSKKAPMRNDAHHVWPTDKKINEIHGNIPYGQTKNGNVVSSNGTKIGSGIEDGENVFEVIDEFKGDIARAHLYFVLTYADKNINNKQGKRVFEKNGSFNTINENFLRTYLNWAKNDNISQFDIDRNNGIYQHQKNRNPFIDYPELIKVYFENDNNFVFKNKGIAKKLVKL